MKHERVNIVLPPMSENWCRRAEQKRVRACNEVATGVQYIAEEIKIIEPEAPMSRSEVMEKAVAEFGPPVDSFKDRPKQEVDR